MTYDKFYELLKKKFYLTRKDWNGKPRTYWTHEDGYEDRFQVKSIIGGASGGNCWGDDAREFGREEEKFLDDLDNFLEEYFPTIPFLIYKKLMKTITISEKSEYEYYGNYTIYQIKTILFKDLFKFLCDNDIIK